MLRNVRFNASLHQLAPQFKIVVRKKLTPAPISPWIGLEKGWEDSGKSLEESLVRITPDDLKTHALVIGASGSGKSVSLEHLMAHWIATGRSFIILDMRGDLVKAALELAADRVDPSLITLFDFRERDRPTGFNPLFGHGEPYFLVLGVLDAIESQSDSFGVQIRDSLNNALMALAEANGTLLDIEPMFYNAPFRATVFSKVKNESVRNFWLRYDELSAEKQNTLAQPVMNKLSMILTPTALRRSLGHPNPIDLGKALNTPGSITLISLAADELHKAGRMMGELMLASIMREIFARISIPENQRNPISLVVDEFENFDPKKFEEILAEGRKYRISGIFANQTLAQLGTVIRSLLLNNIGLKLVFRTGREDAATLNKDLTGDSKAFPLTELPVGEAILWRRNQPIQHIQVNEPLIKHPGSLSPDAQAFIERIKALQPEFVEHPSTSANQASRSTDEKEPKTAVNASLEDWL